MDDRSREVVVELSSALVDEYVAAATEVAQQLTFVQLGVLDRIGRAQHTTVSSIADHAGVAVSTASRWVDRLEALGLATRSPAEHSRREVVVDLTQLGRQLSARWDAARVDVWDRLLADLDDDERDSALAVMPPAVRHTISSSGSARPATPALHETGPEPTDLVRDLGPALAESSPDEVATTLVEHLATAVDGAATLRVATHDGRHLNVVAHGEQHQDDDQHDDGDETVDRSRPGEAFRTDLPVIDTNGPWRLHVPLSTAAQRIGVLTVSPGSTPADPAAFQAAVTAVAAMAGPHLVPRWSIDRRSDLATRSRAWTVGAEVQARQLGPSRARAHGVRIAAHVEPAFNACTDSYDIELLRDGERPVFDVAVLDSDVDRYSAPLVTGLALGALRHARARRLDLPGQAGLLDEAVFGHFRGEATVRFLLLRVDCRDRTCQVVATEGVDLVVQDPDPRRVALPRFEPAGLTGDCRYGATSYDVGAGRRVSILGDGFAAGAATGRRAEMILARSREMSVDEVVRSIGLDLLDRTGPDGPPDDATVVCLDL